jgi:ankyrin repeat protein
VVGLVLDCGANLETADNNGVTALIHAALRGHLEVVLLLDSDANLEATVHGLLLMGSAVLAANTLHFVLCR